MADSLLMTTDRPAPSTALIAELHAEGDPAVRSALAERYGIHTDHAVGIPMARLKAIAAPHAPNPDLAEALWSSGLYEARTVAALIDDPGSVTIEQMNRWCSDFDNWAIVDTVCFNLFDKSPDAWSMVAPWADADGEFTKRAAFALLWALALHDQTADDDQFRTALRLIEANSADQRHLVNKAQTMALRAIGHKRPAVLPDVQELAQRLAASDNTDARRIGRAIVKAFASGAR